MRFASQIDDLGAILDNFPRSRGHWRDFPLKAPPFWAKMLKSARFSLNFKGFHLILVDLARKPRYLVLGAIFPWKRQFVSAAPLSIHQFQMSLFISTFFVSVFGFSFVAFGFSLFSSAAPTSVRAAASVRVPFFQNFFPCHRIQPLPLPPTLCRRARRARPC